MRGRQSLEKRCFRRRWAPAGSDCLLRLTAAARRSAGPGVTGHLPPPGAELLPRTAAGLGAAMPAILEDVVALVQCTDAVANAKAAITARIEKNGGRVAARLGKEVSHIVWERRRSRRPSDKAADEAELMELFRKLEKVRA